MAIKIMIVEDDPSVRRMYERAFELAGFEVMLAKDGTIVYETILLNRPDVVIMDVRMPNFNGLTTLEELKSKARTQNIPVIMLSAYNDEAIIQKALDLGADKYLVKSEIEPKELVETIQSIVKK
jgi:two-component system, OmpR family, alkaline phosphatase synthesis response regulator PhoP